MGLVTLEYSITAHDGSKYTELVDISVKSEKTLSVDLYDGYLVSAKAGDVIKIADYLLIVTVDDFGAATQTREIKLTGEKITSGTANLSVSYKLIETATMEIVSMNDVAHDISLSGASSCNGAISTLSKKAGKELVNSLLSDI